MGAKKQTIGYKYYMSLHMGIGRGPVNEIAEIRVNDVVLTDVPICIAEEGQLVALDKPDLFGGEQKEGGIQGPMFVYNGAPDQELEGPLASTVGTLPSIAASLGGDVPSFRGVVTCWFDGLICAMSPYPKEWSYRVRRTTAGWWNESPWYPAKATINLHSEDDKLIRAMNAAHMIYEVNTNPEWGRGMPADTIDENSFIRAANQLCAEGFGLCIPWFRQETIKEFLPIIIDHIGGAQYVDRGTGKLTLKLIRNDYDVDDLPLFTPETGLLDLVDDAASSEDTAYNEIIVKGFDPTTKEEIAIRVQNLASIQSLGEIISNTIEYKGLPTRDLVARVAARELKAQVPLRRFSVILDRRGWKIAPGMPFRISMPSRGIENMILRAGQIEDGTLVDGKITVKSVQDVFGMPATSYISPTPPVWTPPNFTPLPSPETRLYEVNWRDYYLRSEPADRAAVDAGASFLGEIAKAPPGVQTDGYDIFTRTGSADYVNYATGGFTQWLTLDTALEPLDTSILVKEENRANFMIEFAQGMVVLIDDEEIQLANFDETTGIGDIVRGVADTIPAAHATDSTIWLIDDEIVSDGKEYQDGEVVYAKVATRTSAGLLALDDAAEDMIEVNQRVFRPYPPGDVQQNGTSVYLPRPIESEPEITWTHRDRIVEADAVVGHLEGSVGPEAGTTYTIRIYEDDGVTLLSTHDGIVGTSFTYDGTLQTADGGPASVVMQLESVRDDLPSQFHYTFPVAISGGWGYGWGDDWGG